MKFNNQNNYHTTSTIPLQKSGEFKTDLKEMSTKKFDNFNTNKSIKPESTILNDVLKARELGAQYAASAPNREMILAQLRELSFEDLKFRENELNEEIESKKMIERHNAGELSEEETKHFVALFINISAVHQLMLEKLDERFEKRRLMAEEYEKQHFERSHNDL